MQLGDDRSNVGDGIPDYLSNNDDPRVLLAWYRSHLANERTFLSWCRTGISLLAFGFVVEKLDLFTSHLMAQIGDSSVVTAEPHLAYLSLFCFIMAGLATLFAGVRFLRSRRHINRGEAQYSILPDVLAAVSVTGIVAAALVLGLARMFG